MKTDSFLGALKNKGITFFTGVPDSLLGVFCDGLVEEYGVNSRNHIVAHNEGGCVGLASGYHLATGRIPCVYLQNSGIGNIINPVASLTHHKVYGIPMLFVVGWRGEPGVKDEPQHVFQGKVTLKLLEDIDIECSVIDENTSVEQLEEVLGSYDNIFANGFSAALVIRKGALSGGNHKYENGYTLNREHAIRIAAEAAGKDVIVSTTGKISRELFETREQRKESHEKDFLTVGSMGHSAMIAAGIALQKPELRVWCIDGDGALLMHMGVIGSVGSLKPKRFIHVVLNNAAHETVGGMPTAAGGMDLSAIALAGGYCSVFQANNGQSLKCVLEQAKKVEGPVFVEVSVALGSRSDLGRPTTTTHDNKRAFMAFLSKGEDCGL